MITLKAPLVHHHDDCAGTISWDSSQIEDRGAVRRLLHELEIYNYSARRERKRSRRYRKKEKTAERETKSKGLYSCCRTRTPASHYIHRERDRERRIYIKRATTSSKYIYIYITRSSSSLAYIRISRAGIIKEMSESFVVLYTSRFQLWTYCRLAWEILFYIALFAGPVGAFVQCRSRWNDYCGV